MLSRSPQLLRRLASRRFLSSPSSISFRPRRRPHPNYRPLVARGPSRSGPKDPLTDDPPNEGDDEIPPRDELEQEFGPELADALRDRQRTARQGNVTVEEYLKMADYITSEPGSMEELQGERRALALDAWDEEDRKTFLENIDALIEEERVKSLELGDIEFPEEEEEEDEKAKKEREQKIKIVSETTKISEEEVEELDEELDDDGAPIDHLQLVSPDADWGEMIVRVDRVQKVQKGGTMVSYRALIVGGNANGCAGFGIGKANNPQDATRKASRQCKRNIYFVDRHHGAGLTRDLAGRHNSCKVVLRAVDPYNGLHGHPLICDILLFFGIADCTAKSFGNRNQFNVVRATFKALLTHESMEEIALKRGKRLMNLERARRLGI